MGLDCLWCLQKVHHKFKYHIIPRGAGNTPEERGILGEMILPSGVVCKRCDNYFAQELDPALASFPDVQRAKVMRNIRNYAGNPPSDSQGENRLQRTRSGAIIVNQAEDPRLQILRNGNINIKYGGLKGINHQGLSRELHKIAFEAHFHDMSKKRGISSALEELNRPEWKHIRNYVRAPTPNSFRPYGMKRGGGAWANTALIFQSTPEESAYPQINYVGCIITVPEVRFHVTLGKDKHSLDHMLSQLSNLASRSYLDAQLVIRDKNGAVVIV